MIQGDRGGFPRVSGRRVTTNHPEIPRTMKSRFLPLLLFAPFAAVRGGEVALPSPPPPAFADTESTANAPLPAAMVGRARLLKARVALVATPSNNVQVAFGPAREPGGPLPHGDESLAFGWDAGSWFVASPTGRVEAPPAVAAEGAAPRALVLSLRVAESGAPVSFEAREDGATNLLFAALSEAPPDWLFSRGWNAARVDVRGTDPRGDEAVSVRLDTDMGVLILR